LKKVISDPPATASLRWLLLYIILQQKHTWCFVNIESLHHETKLCKDALQSIRLVTFTKMVIFVSAVVTFEKPKVESSSPTRLPSTDEDGHWEDSVEFNEL